MKYLCNTLIALETGLTRRLKRAGCPINLRPFGRNPLGDSKSINIFRNHSTHPENDGQACDWCFTTMGYGEMKLRRTKRDLGKFSVQSQPIPSQSSNGVSLLLREPQSPHVKYLKTRLIGLTACKIRSKTARAQPPFQKLAINTCVIMFCAKCLAWTLLLVGNNSRDRDLVHTVCIGCWF